MKHLVIFLIFSWAGYTSAQKFPNLAMTPPMGWNSWNTFSTHINEQLVLETADKLISTGLKNAGYTYLILDDAWMAANRNEKGDLVADPQKFPHGMKYIADYVHSKGLKFGLYNCAGTKTCAGYPGTRGYEYQDARYYASIGIDYLKFDWCNSDGINAKEAYVTMSKAIKLAGRPVIFSLCEWGTSKPWQWADTVGHLWRTTGDIGNQWEGLKNNGTWSANSVMKIVDLQADLRNYAGPGHWNDPDMLEVGNGLKESEDRSHFSLWCMMAAPLMLGNDIRNMNPSTSKILLRPEVIALDQDRLGIQAYRIEQQDSLEVWIKPLENQELGICFLNRSTKAQKAVYDWQTHPIQDDLSHTNVDFRKTKYTLNDLWSGKNLGSTDRSLSQVIAPHDVLLVRLRK